MSKTRMTPTCTAIITPKVARSGRPAGATRHICRLPVWCDGLCRLHHPLARLARIQRRINRHERALRHLQAQLARVESAGLSTHDHPGQLRIFEDDRATA